MSLCLTMTMLIGKMYRENRIGPSIEPCGTLDHNLNGLNKAEQ